jgi:hypothetical protein
LEVVFRAVLADREEVVVFFRFGLAFLPPPVSLLTVAQARRSASPVLTPRRL